MLWQMGPVSRTDVASGLLGKDHDTRKPARAAAIAGLPDVRII